MFYVMIQPAELRCCPEWWDSFPFFPCSQSVSSQLFKLSPQPWRLERDRKSEDRVQTRQYGKGKTAFLTAFLLQHPYQWNTLNCKQPPSWMRSVISDSAQHVTPAWPFLSMKHHYGWQVVSGGTAKTQWTRGLLCRANGSLCLQWNHDFSNSPLHKNLPLFPVCREKTQTACAISRVGANDTPNTINNVIFCSWY